MAEKPTALAVWLKKQLEARDWSVDDLAERTQLNRSTLFHYLTDRSRPIRATMEKICAAFGVPVEEGLAQYSARKVGRPRSRRRSRRVPASR